MSYVTLHASRWGIRGMAIGSSGRVVIEVDPDLKALLHAALNRDGLTMKDWFVCNANQYLRETVQPALRFAEPEFSAGGSR